MPFQKGKSGNPGGRPKVAKDVQALARTHTKTAIETLVKCMQTADPRTRVAAAQALLDRGYGKPAQAVTGEADQPIEHVFRWRGE